MTAVKPDPRLAGAVVIFDLDGTLVDTAQDIVRALNEVMASDGLADVPLRDVRDMVGRGSRALLRRAYARQGTGLPEPLMDRRQSAFLASYDADIAGRSRPFADAEATLDALAASGATSVIATNKPQHLTDRLMTALGWTERFARVLGADAASHKKPHRAHLVEAAGGEAALARAVMIGDSSVDVAAARAAGIPVAVVRHGYSETPADALGADVVMDGLSETVEAAATLIVAAEPKT